MVGERSATGCWEWDPTTEELYGVRRNFYEGKDLFRVLGMQRGKPGSMQHDLAEPHGESVCSPIIPWELPAWVALNHGSELTCDSRKQGWPVFDNNVWLVAGSEPIISFMRPVEQDMPSINAETNNTNYYVHCTY